MRLSRVVLAAFLLLALDRSRAVTQQASVFTPASSIPNPEISVKQIIEEEPSREESDFFIASMTEGERNTEFEPRAYTNFNGYENGPLPETPESVGCLYLFARSTDKNCNPANRNLNPPVGGASQNIAIVIAYDHPDSSLDFVTFSKQYGLAPSGFMGTVYASGRVPGRDNSQLQGWDLEASFDLEWAHAMAPEANEVLVEADDNTFSALTQAVDKAASEIEKAGGGIVSMSWSWPAGEITEDLRSKFESVILKYKSVIFVVCTGDKGNVVYPASSPNVIAVGGTIIQRDDQGEFQTESAWSSSGAGLGDPPRPSFQDGIQLVLDRRGIADISAIANNIRAGGQSSGLSFYSRSFGWIGFGGTSASAPIIAGLIANARSKGNASRFGTSDELLSMYTRFHRVGQTAFNSIVSGHCGSLSSPFDATAGWNFCTGIGSPNGLAGL